METRGSEWYAFVLPTIKKAIRIFELLFLNIFCLACIKVELGCISASGSSNTGRGKKNYSRVICASNQIKFSDKLIEKAKPCG